MAHHILVVDDDIDIRALIQTVLQDDGYSVATAANGQEALVQVIENRPQVILLDLQMPVMNGWELLTQLRQAGVTVPIVFMSAGYRVRAEAERHGADGYLAKPFDIAAVLDIADRFTAQ